MYNVSVSGGVQWQEPVPELRRLPHAAMPCLLREQEVPQQEPLHA